MSTFSSNAPRSKAPLLLAVLAIVLVALGALGWVLKPKLEADPPVISLSSNADTLGVAPVELTIADKGTGLRSYSAVLVQAGTEHVLGKEDLAQPVAEKKFTIALAKVPGLKEGPATLKVTAKDASFWNLGKGNDAAFEKKLEIDITPPTIELIADDRYVNFGGVGVVVYKPSTDTATTAIKLGDYTFKAFNNVIKGHPEYYLGLFSHAYNVPPEARPVIVATDKAGNTREMRIAYELKDVKYRKSTIALSDSFLANKIVPLVKDVSKRSAGTKEVFVAVNKTLRKENEDKITEVTGKATPKILWDGAAFAQLSNSKVEANFADHRTYTYNGEPVDSAYHLGYDLSVTKNYPVEASNAGTVAFTGDLGIYGNTVILDHGLGLFTLYGHLNSIDVKVGDTVTKRQILGKTGETGLAAGDHLHFGIYLDGVPILPVEWWDQKWIADNLTPKLEGRSGEEIHESQQSQRIAAKKAAKAAGKPAGKKRR